MNEDKDLPALRRSAITPQLFNSLELDLAQNKIEKAGSDSHSELPATPALNQVSRNKSLLNGLVQTCTQRPFLPEVPITPKSDLEFKQQFALQQQRNDIANQNNQHQQSVQAKQKEFSTQEQLEGNRTQRLLKHFDNFQQNIPVPQSFATSKQSIDQEAARITQDFDNTKQGIAAIRDFIEKEF